MNRISQMPIICSIAVILSCSPSSNETASEPKTEPIETLSPTTENVTLKKEKEFANKTTVVVSESKDKLAKYYDIPHIKEFYEYEMEMEAIAPRDLFVPDSLADLSYGDLRLLRNEVFARNGYLFSDGFLRGYFNRFEWYRPIFDVDSFQIIMSKEEQSLVKRLLKEEEKRRENLTFTKNGIQLYNADLVANVKQFKSVDQKIIDDLKTNNFSIVNAKRQMPFYIYDKNAYQYVPHYITTDLYLFILHKYFSRALEKLDENFMSSSLEKLLKGVITEISQNPKYESLQEKSWVETYAKIALYALTDISQQVPEEYKQAYEFEESAITNESGSPSFIANQLIEYSELKPRGHYTKSANLKRYFKAFKWISLSGIDLSKDHELKGLITLAYIIKSSPKLNQIYKDYTSTISRLAGQEDNISLKDIFNALDTNDSITKVLDGQNVAKLKSGLSSLNKERIKTVLGKDFKTEERNTKRLYFLSATYSISGDIFSKLVHVNGNKSKRPFPRGLDIPAVFGNNTAEKIIKDEYKDDEAWPEYAGRLKNLQEQFRKFEGWNSNYGAKAVKTALACTAESDNYPGFMKTDAYNRKELSTMLSSWVHVKHDLILYQEKPFAAEAGQGGGPEPPKHYSYVEPNLEFWQESLKLVEWLNGFSMFDYTFGSKLQSISEIGYDLQNAAEKQLKGEKLTDEEHEKLSWIGGRIEHILLGLLETDHLPEREKSMALIADVYAYNGVNLNAAVGLADDIYVLVPINNEYYLARGAVFSYYEFTGKIYNDDEWKKDVRLRQMDKRPDWIKPLINNQIQPLEGQMEFRYPGYGLYY